MAPGGEQEADQLAQIDVDLAELNAHVNNWLQDRFLSSDDVSALNLEDIAGLVAWLQQWHTHFDSYGDSDFSSVQARLAQIRVEIDKSITTFTDMAANLPKDPED